MSERPDHETASSLARRVHCPGSARMERPFRGVDDSTEDSRHGDRVHAALAARKPDNTLDEDSPEWLELSDDEQTTTEICAALEKKTLSPFITEHGGPSSILRERRYYIRNYTGEVFSAQLDVVYEFKSGIAVILDYKSGFGDTDESSGNWQLLAQVACFAHGIGYNMIAAGIIQPKGGVPDLVGYSPGEQAAAEREVLRIIAETEKPDAPLHPGTWCSFCKAKLVCPALRSEQAALSQMTLQTEPGALVTGDDLAGLLDRCGAVTKFIACVQAEAKRRLSAGEEVPGWELAPGATRRIITDPQAALVALTPLGVTPELMLSAVAVKVAELEKITRKASGLKGAQAKQAFENALADCIERKQNAPQLKRIGAQIEDSTEE